MDHTHKPLSPSTQTPLVAWVTVTPRGVVATLVQDRRPARRRQLREDPNGAQMSAQERLRRHSSANTR